MSDPHPLARLLDAASYGRFPPADGGVEVMPPDGDDTCAVVSFTGHAVVLTDRPEDDVRARAGAAPGFGDAFAPRFVEWLGEGREVGSLDVVLVAPPGSRPPGAARPSTRWDEHPRVRRSRAHRRSVGVWETDHGIATVGRGLVGRWEVAVELTVDDAPRGAGRALALAGLANVPTDAVAWAQVAAGNARSLRAFLAAGFVPVGAEVLFSAAP